MTKNIIMQYDFNQVNSTIVADTTSTGAAGVIRNYDAGGATIINETIYGKDVKAISLPGGNDGGYIQLPDGILKNNSGITISTWCKLNSISDFQTLWSFGKDCSIYLDLFTSEDSSQAIISPCVTSGGRSQECSIPTKACIKINKWSLITVTLTDFPKPSILSLYIDGIFIDSISQNRLSSSELSASTNSYIGFGSMSEEPCCCEIAKFELFNYDMTTNEVQNLFDISSCSRISADMEELTFPSSITDNLSLPVNGTYGSTIYWESSNDLRLSSLGIINRPSAGTPDELISLTAIIKNGESQQLKTFSIYVKANPTDDIILEADLHNINLSDIHSVYQDLLLPRIGSSGSHIEWESSAPEYIGTTGIVTRPLRDQPNAKVILTATATLNETSTKRQFTAYVLPQYELPNIKKIMPFYITTSTHLPPSLPSKVRVQYTNGLYGDEFIDWEDISPTAYVNNGEFSVVGKLSSYDIHLTRIITVTDCNNTYAKLGTSIPLKEVTINGDNIFTQNYNRSLDYLKLLEPDRMLYNFRLTYCHDTKGAKPLGGWDEPTGLLRGHSTGHFLSGLALAYCSSKEEEIKSKIDYMVQSLYELQKLSKGSPQDFETICSPTSAAQSNWSKDTSTWGEGFLSAYSPDQFALLEQFTPYATIWAPYYTLHKILAGLIDCYLYADNKTALTVAEGIASWTYERLSACSQETRAKMWSMYIAGEYGGMNESLATLYTITGDEKYLDAAKMFDNPKIFNGLAKGLDTIPGIHANQHIPQIIGAMSEYKATNDIKYYYIAKYFWEIVTNHYMYSIGGVGRGENFKEPDILAGNIETDRNCETCAAYNMLKLTKDLYEYEPNNAQLMDYYERALINHIVASQNPIVTKDMHHGVTYMLPIGPGQHKGYGSDYHEFTCCHGTGMENHVKYQDATYFASNDNNTLYVNLYIPSTMKWIDKGIIITQNQPFPSENIRLTIEGNGDFTLKLRIPYWVNTNPTVKVNGSLIVDVPDTSSYLTITRNWCNGDQIEIEMPFTLHIDKTRDTLDGSILASVMYGPFVMVAEDSNKNYHTLILSPNLEDSFIIKKGSCLNDIELNYHGLVFIPMYKAYDIDYHTYFKIIIPAV